MSLTAAAIASMLWLQIANSVAWMTLPVLAPQIAPLAGVPVSAIGHLAGVMFAGALLPTLLSSIVMPRIGPVRTNQLTTALAAVGLLIAATGSWPALLIGAVIIGAGYGPGAPAASAVLARHAAASRLGLIFSIRQSGVPLGGLLAGATLPIIAVSFGATAAIVATAAFGLLAAAMVQPVRGRLDAPLISAQPASVRDLVEKLSFRAALGAHPDLPRVTYSGFAAAAVQGAVFALLVTFLVERGGFDLVTAGFVFAAMHMAGAAARVAFGYASDGFVQPQKLLSILALVGIAALVLLLLNPRALPFALVLGLAMIIGATISGWNGVLMAELARLAPAQLVGSVSAAAVTCIYVGYMAGPIVSSATIAYSGSYVWGFVPVLAALGAAAVLQWVRR